MKYIELNEIDSTNAYLSERLLSGEITEPTTVFTHSQNKGKGMGQNIWVSDNDKNALFSIALFTEIKTEEIFKVSLATSMSIYEFLKLKGITTKIKWPNDIYYDGKKLGGILIENKLDGNVVKASVIGVGLNLNQEKFPKWLPNPISLKNITGHDYDAKEFITGISEMVAKKLNEIKDVPFSDLRLDYLLNLYCFGKIMMWKIQGIKDEISGSIVDVKPSGKIVVQAVSGQLCECDIKEIKLIDDF